MPNWSNTLYACIGDPTEIRQLHNAIKTNARRKTSRVKNGFGTLWLGNIIDQLGGNWEEWKCRGEITGFQMEKDAKKLTIYQSTAWCEQEGFRKFIEKKFPSIRSITWTLNLVVDGMEQMTILANTFLNAITWNPTRTSIHSRLLKRRLNSFLGL